MSSTFTIRLIGFFATAIAVGMFFAATVRPGTLSYDGFMFGLVVGVLGAGGIWLMLARNAQPTHTKTPSTQCGQL